MPNGALTIEDVLEEAGLISKWREEGLREAAKNLKAMGLPPDRIAAATGLDPETIEAL